MAAIELGIVSTKVDSADESGLVDPKQSCNMGNLRNFSDGREKKFDLWWGRIRNELWIRLPMFAILNSINLVPFLFAAPLPMLWEDILP